MAQAKVLADEFYLKALIQSGLSEGIFKKDDFGDTLKRKSHGYSILLQRLRDLLMLFDEIEFISDMGEGLEGSFSELAPRPGISIPARLGQRYCGFDCPDTLRLLSLSGDFFGEINDVTAELGISITNHWDSGIEYKSASILRDRIREELEKAPNEREGLDYDIEVWGMVPYYAKRKVKGFDKLSIMLICKLIDIYLDYPQQVIFSYIPRMFPLVEDWDALDFLADILSSIWYVAQQINLYMEISDYNQCTIALGMKSTPDAWTQAEGASEVLWLSLSALDPDGLYLPMISSLDGIFKLRKAQHILDFREVIWAWVHEIKLGNISSAEKVSKEIKNANKAMRKLETCAKVNDILLFLALPSIVIDTLAGIPTTAALLTASGLGLKAYSSQLDRRRRWALFLNR